MDDCGAVEGKKKTNDEKGRKNLEGERKRNEYCDGEGDVKDR